MSKVITFSRVFPSYHPRAGEPTYFVEKVLKSLEPESKTWDTPYARLLNGGLPLYVGDIGLEPKHHTIRAGHRFKAGDYFKPVVWTLPGGRFTKGNKQIQFAPDIQIKKVWDFDIAGEDGKFFVDRSPFTSRGMFLSELSKNDGLTGDDFKAWFKHPKAFEGQIICWNESIEY